MVSVGQKSVFGIIDDKKGKDSLCPGDDLSLVREIANKNIVTVSVVLKGNARRKCKHLSGMYWGGGVI